LLTSDNNVMFFIPEGFAHGFITLEDDTIFSYKCNKPYNKEFESGILWNDPDLNIDWMLYGDEPIMSGKDLTLPTLEELNQNL
jgi:dTDP-4-dehydrorhamnose 3,5-epimerase